MDFILYFGFILVLIYIVQDLICTEETEGRQEHLGMDYYEDVDGNPQWNAHYKYSYRVNGKKYTSYYIIGTFIESIFAREENVIIKYNKKFPSISKIKGNYSLIIIGVLLVIIYVVIKYHVFDFIFNYIKYSGQM